MASRLQTVDDKLLMLDGHLVYADECCCVASECPAAVDMPVLCKVTVHCPWVDKDLYVEFSHVDGVNLWTEGFSPIVGDEANAAILYEIEGFNDCYDGGVDGDCEDLTPSRPVDVSCDDGGNSGVWEGEMKYAVRRLVYSLYVKVECVCDTVTKKRYRKLTWHYCTSAMLQGRFIGTYTLEAFVHDFNIVPNTGHACDEFPRFNNLGETYTEPHTWYHPDFNTTGGAFIGNQFYSNGCYVLYQDADWVEVPMGEDFFNPGSFNKTPKVYFRQDSTDPDNIINLCGETNAHDGNCGVGDESIYVTVQDWCYPDDPDDCPTEWVEWHMEVPTTNWPYWDPVVGQDCIEVTGWSMDGPWPPDGVTVDATYTYGSDYVPHEITFRMAIPASECP